LIPEISKRFRQRLFRHIVCVSTSNLRQVLVGHNPSNIQSGSAVFEYVLDHGNALGAEVALSEPSATFLYSITALERGASSADLSAALWLPFSTTEAYIAVQNTSATPLRISASLEYAGSSHPFLTGALIVPHGSQLIEVPTADLWRIGSKNPDRFAGIRLSHDGPNGALITSGWTEDDTTGYSNMMTLWDPSEHHGTSLSATEVFVGTRTDLLASGKSLSIDSNLVLFNTSATGSVRPAAEFLYTDHGHVARAHIDVSAIPPLGTVKIDLGDLSRKGQIPIAISVGAVSVTYDGPDGSLMGRVYGIGDNATFGFYSVLESYTGSAINEIYWTTGGDYTSLLAVTNFAVIPDRVTVVVTYNGGMLSLPPIDLDPSQTATVNLRDVKSLLPPGVTFGGYRIVGSSKRQSKLLAKQHIVSERLGTSAPFYGTTIYLYQISLDPWITISSVGQNSSFTATLYFSDYTQTIGCTLDTTTSTADHTIATVSGFTLTGEGGGNTYYQCHSTAYPVDSYGNPGDIAPIGTIKVGVPNSVGFISTVSSAANTNCTTGMAGWDRVMFLGLYDQNGYPYAHNNVSVTDAIAVGSPNALGIGSASTGTGYTNSSRQWPDHYSVCSSVCPVSTGQTNATQTWKWNTTNSLPIGNALVYKCGSITFDGQ
jgi:hypothetical protein